MFWHSSFSGSANFRLTTLYVSTLSLNSRIRNGPFTSTLSSSSPSALFLATDS